MQLTSFGIVLADAAVEKSAVQVVPDTLLFSFIIFGVLLAILYKFAWGPISEGLELREKKMAEERLKVLRLPMPKLNQLWRLTTKRSPVLNRKQLR